MKLIQCLTATLLMLSVLICTPIAKAGTGTELLDMLAMLRAETEDATFTGDHGEHDRAFLLRKLDAAKVALDEARFCKAVKDLQDFNSYLDRLNRLAQSENGPHGVTVHDMSQVYSLSDAIINILLGQRGLNCQQ
jgi:hypothetical protein